jgi:predicted transglutaminase-like cysteine proteinase
MRSSLIAVAAAATVLMSTSAFAQAYYRAGQQIDTPMSPQHAQAMANKQPGQCAKEVSKMQDQVGLRIQQWATGAETRGSVNSELQAAAGAAATGDEDTCWRWYDRAQQTVR